MSDIVERLEQRWAILTTENDRLRAEIERLRTQSQTVADEAIRLKDERDELKADNERLRAALKPFAEIGVPKAWVGTVWEHQVRPGDPIIVCRGYGQITRLDFEEARRALEQK